MVLWGRIRRDDRLRRQLSSSDADDAAAIDIGLTLDVNIALTLAIIPPPTSFLALFVVKRILHQQQF